MLRLLQLITDNRNRNNGLKGGNVLREPFSLKSFGFFTDDPL